MKTESLLKPNLTTKNPRDPQTVAIVAAILAMGRGGLNESNDLRKRYEIRKCIQDAKMIMGIVDEEA